MTIVYRIYQVCVCLPLLLIATIITALTTAIGCSLGDGHFWGYYPGKLWSRVVITMLLLRVKVTGREHLTEGQSYVFVSNHQGAFDIFLIYGYLCRNFKWMMKWQLKKIPLVGLACAKAHHIFVDKRGPSRIKASYDEARATLKDGMSLVVFPEGSRSFSGHMGAFRRGAFMLAAELQLPIVPLTINGSFDVLPRDRRWLLPDRHPMTLTIHRPIVPKSREAEDVQLVMNESHNAIASALAPEYQGYVEC